MTISPLPRFGLALSLALATIGAALPVAAAAQLPAALPSETWSHTASLLADGRVLVTGGFNLGEEYRDAYLYDAATNRWMRTGRMQLRRYGHRALSLRDGRVLVVGGSSSKRTEIFDPRTGRWTSAGRLRRPRDSGAASIVLADGSVLVTGGYDNAFPSNSELDTTLAMSDLWSPVTRRWTRAADMLDARMGHSATLLRDGRVLVAGGTGRTEWLASAEIWDPRTRSWSRAASMSRARADHVALLLRDGRVLVVAGEDETGANDAGAEIYDPASDRWLPVRPRAPRDGATATLLPDGRVLVAGGLRAGATTEIFDPATGRFEVGPALAAGRAEHTALLLGDGSILLTGGVAADGRTVLSSAERVRVPRRTARSTR